MAVERSARTDFFRFLSLRRVIYVLLLVALIREASPIVVPWLSEQDWTFGGDDVVDIAAFTEDHFWLLINIGEKQQKAGEIEVARAAFELARSEAERKGHDRRFAIASSKMAGLMVESGSPEAALGIYEKLHANWQERADERPHDRERLRDLGSSHMTLGDLRSDLGDVAKASEHYRAVSEIWSFFVEDDPGNLQKRHELAQIHIIAGAALNRLHDFQGARQHAERARDLYQGLTEADPASSAWQRRLAKTQSLLGDALHLLDQPAKAFAAYKEGLSIFETLAKENPDDQGIQYDLGFAYQDLGDSYYENDQFIDALAMYENRQAQFDKLIGRDTDDVIYRRDLATIHARVGAVKLELEDVDGAREAFTAGLDLTKGLAAEAPDDRGVLSQLAKAHRQMGLVLDVSGRFEEAEDAYGESRAIYERLFEAEPANAEWPRELLTVHINLSELATNRGQIDATQEHLTSALSIATTLDKEGLLAPKDEWIIGELQSRLAELGKAKN